MKARQRPEMMILSQTNASIYEPSGREVCISITGPDKPLPALSPQFLAVLRVAFSDITEPIDLPGYALFNDGHAREIVGFAREWRDVERVVIHCQAGLSRSPGIALGLCELFTWGSLSDLESKHPLANRFVQRELVRVGREVLQREG